MSFAEVCKIHRVTEAERVDLAHFLAAMRYKATIEACLKEDNT